MLGCCCYVGSVAMEYWSEAVVEIQEPALRIRQLGRRRQRLEAEKEDGLTPCFVRWDDADDMLETDFCRVLRPFAVRPCQAEFDAFLA